MDLITVRQTLLNTQLLQNYPNRTLYYYSDSVDSDPAAPPSGYLINNMPNISLIMSTSGLATLTGNVTFNNAPVYNAKVQVDGTARYAMTNTQDNYELPYLTPGTISITASKNLLNDVHISGIELVAEETTVQDIEMTMMTCLYFWRCCRSGFRRPNRRCISYNFCI